MLYIYIYIYIYYSYAQHISLTRNHLKGHIDVKKISRLKAKLYFNHGFNVYFIICIIYLNAFESENECNLFQML